MQNAILYTTEGCHLCEQAAALLAPWRANGRLQLQEVDIVDDDDLMERYGVRIPVLRLSDSGRELGWPFVTAALEQFLTCD